MRKFLAVLTGILALSTATVPASANVAAGINHKPIVADTGLTQVRYGHHRRHGFGFGIGLGLPLLAYGYPRYRYYDDYDDGYYRPRRYYGGSRYYRSYGGYGGYGYGNRHHHRRHW